MPIYEYKCDDCGTLDQKITSVRLRDFPGPCECGGDNKRLHSIPSRVWAPTRSGQ